MTHVRLMVEPLSTCMSGAPMIRAWGAGTEIYIKLKYFTPITILQTSFKTETKIFSIENYLSLVAKHSLNNIITLIHQFCR